MCNLTEEAVSKMEEDRKDDAEVKCNKGNCQRGLDKGREFRDFMQVLSPACTQVQPMACMQARSPA